jgi:hypothetical protein
LWFRTGRKKKKLKYLDSAWSGGIPEANKMDRGAKERIIGAMKPFARTCERIQGMSMQTSDF